MVKEAIDAFIAGEEWGKAKKVARELEPRYLQTVSTIDSIVSENSYFSNEFKNPVLVLFVTILVHLLVARGFFIVLYFHYPLRMWIGIFFISAHIHCVYSFVCIALVLNQ